MPPSALLERVASTLRSVAARELLPRFRALSTADVERKPSSDDPDDLVTSADRAAEAAYAEELPALVPGSWVLGEEAVAADPALMDRLRGPHPVWVIDPLDGTRNFAAGHGPFGTMVALVERGTIVAGGIYLPEGDRMLVAERGGGAFLDGRALRPMSDPGSVLAGTINTRFIPRALVDALAPRAVGHRQIPPVVCAAHEYAELAEGRKDYVLYYRLLPWDHAPGAIVLREAGGVVRHPDGRDYEITDGSEATLLAPSEASWTRARAALFG